MPNNTINCKPHSGKWFSVSGNIDSEIYCEYCYYSGCFDPNNFKVINSSEYYGNSNLKCSCSKKDSHSKENPIECVCCNYIHNLMCGSFEAVTKCKNCDKDIYTLSQKLCEYCSYSLEKCMWCGDKIMCGNYYIEKLSTILNELEEPMDKSFIDKYENKSVDEMKSFIKNYNHY